MSSCNYVHVHVEGETANEGAYTYVQIHSRSCSRSSKLSILCPTVMKLMWDDDLKIRLRKTEPTHVGLPRARKIYKLRYAYQRNGRYLCKYVCIYICICVTQMYACPKHMHIHIMQRTREIYYRCTCVWCVCVCVCMCGPFLSHLKLSSAIRDKGRRVDFGFYQLPRLPLLALQSICCRTRSA